MVPEELRYTAEHEWVRAHGDGTATFGITHFAQDALGDIVYVSLPSVGDGLAAGAACGEVESTKSVSDVYAPVAGTVVERNDALDQSPETVNSDPYGAGWLVKIQLSDPASVDTLLTATEYHALTTSH